MADRVAASLALIRPLSIGLYGLVPAGTVLGALTERIALRRPLKSILAPRVWSTAVRTAASIGTVRLLYIWSGLGRGGSGGAAVTGEDEGLGAAVIVFGLWTICFAAGARLGSALQPVGLTGGIACGKSTVAGMLSNTDDGKKGEGGDDGKDYSRAAAAVSFDIIDVDKIGHDILIPDKLGADSAYDRVVAEFGPGILESEPCIGKDGIRTKPPIDRRKLGDVIFPDTKKRRKLNGISHPLISKIMMKRIVKYNLFPRRSRGGRLAPIVAVDIPLLFEVGMKMRALFGLTVVVACRPSVQLERLTERCTDLTREQCQKRIDSQMPIDAKVRMADVVVWNDGTVEELRGEVGRAREEVVGRVRGWGGVTVTRAVLVLGFGVVAKALVAS